MLNLPSPQRLYRNIVYCNIGFMDADHRVEFDVRVGLGEGGGPGHNRWHPDISPVARVKPGELIALDLWDGLDAQVVPDTSPQELLDFNGFRTHAMTGPIFIEGAEPGDLLHTEIVRIEPDNRGFTCVLPNLGLLSDRLSEPFIVWWTLEDGVARSEDLPGVTIPSAPFIGLTRMARSA